MSVNPSDQQPALYLNQGKIWEALVDNSIESSYLKTICTAEVYGKPYPKDSSEELKARVHAIVFPVPTLRPALGRK